MTVEVIERCDQIAPIAGGHTDVQVELREIGKTVLPPDGADINDARRSRPPDRSSPNPSRKPAPPPFGRGLVLAPHGLFDRAPEGFKYASAAPNPATGIHCELH